MNQSNLKNLLFILLVFIIGCQTPAKKSSPETMPEVIDAIGTMTEGLTNKDISKEDLKRVAIQAQKDPSVKSAIESVNNAMQATQSGVRYCPVDGKRFSNRVDKCPVCGATLKDLE